MNQDTALAKQKPGTILATLAVPASTQNPQDVASPEFAARLEALFPQINQVGIKLEGMGFNVRLTPNDVLTHYGPKVVHALPQEDLDRLASIYGTRANNDATQSYFHLSIALFQTNQRHTEPVFVELKHSDPPGRSKETDWLLTKSFANLDIALEAIQRSIELVQSHGTTPSHALLLREAENGSA